jgi:hypothetical protein
VDFNALSMCEKPRFLSGCGTGLQWAGCHAGTRFRVRGKNPQIALVNMTKIMVLLANLR